MRTRWLVCKRDGCWWVCDRSGRLRYASGDYWMALAFALMQGERKPMPYVTFTSSDLPMYRDTAWTEIMRRIWQPKPWSADAIDDAFRQLGEDDPEEEDE